MLPLKQYIYDLMRDKRSDFLSRLVKGHLLILSYIYGFLVKCHNFFYDVNLLKSHKAAGVIISIGNITLGGTGKTPFAIMLAGRLAGNQKEKIAVLIRGYGEDEWKLLEDKLGTIGARVFVGRDRIKTAKGALEWGARAIILDDGFQHRRLARDLDIVLLDSANPFGNGRIFPRGVLREPVANLKRADIIVLTKADKGKDNIALIKGELKEISQRQPVIEAVHRPAELFGLWEGERREPSSIGGKRVCVFSGVSDPSYFRHTVEKTGATVELEFIFPDHYPYKKRDLEEILEKCKAAKIDTIITTEKDAVKLKRFATMADSRVFVLAIELKITEGEEKLDAEVHRLYMRECSKSF